MNTDITRMNPIQLIEHFLGWKSILIFIIMLSYIILVEYFSTKINNEDLFEFRIAFVVGGSLILSILIASFMY